jgi:hypothetical protein
MQRLFRHSAALFLSLAMVLSAAPAFAASGNKTAATTTGGAAASRRLSALQRGVNLSGWYGGWDAYTPGHIATWTTPVDLQFIHSMGLQYVRLCIDPVQLTTGGYDSPASVAALARLDRSIDDTLTAKLNVLITVFPRSDYKQALLTPAGAESYVDLWKFLAAHYASRDPERVFFDLLNEPELNDIALWNALQERVTQAIRTVDKKHTLIATGAKFDGLDELLQIVPLHDANVIYTFHFYEPFPFTHQGAGWGSPEWMQLHNVPYPADPEKLGPMIANMSDPSARNALSAYSSEGWDATVIHRRLSLARTWANQHHVPVICNEFGAYRDTIPEDTRALYLHDVRTALESLHIAWAEWDYRGNFGIVTHAADGSIVPDAPMIEALGLALPVAQQPMPLSQAATEPAAAASSPK